MFNVLWYKNFNLCLSRELFELPRILPAPPPPPPSRHPFFLPSVVVFTAGADAGVKQHILASLMPWLPLLMLPPRCPHGCLTYGAPAVIKNKQIEMQMVIYWFIITHYYLYNRPVLIETSRLEHNCKYMIMQDSAYYRQMCGSSAWKCSSVVSFSGCITAHEGLALRIYSNKPQRPSRENVACGFTVWLLQLYEDELNRRLWSSSWG